MSIPSPFTMADPSPIKGLYGFLLRRKRICIAELCGNLGYHKITGHNRSRPENHHGRTGPYSELPKDEQISVRHRLLTGPLHHPDTSQATRPWYGGYSIADSGNAVAGRARI